MTCWSTDEGWDTTLVLEVLQMNDWCVVSERMVVSTLSVSVNPLEMWAATALAPLYGDLKAEDLPSPFLLIWVILKLNLS